MLNKKRWRSDIKGFTLVEVLIAIVILGIVMGTVYASYTATLRITKDSAYERELYSMSRLALSRIRGDLGKVVPYSGAYGFKSERSDVDDREFSNLSFLSTAHLFANADNEAGIARIEYKIEQSDAGDDFVLRRIDRLRLSKDSPEEADNMDKGFIICRNIKYFDVILFDAKGEEYESWNSSSDISEQRDRLPSRIKIRLGLIDRNNAEGAYPFYTEIYLPVTRVENETTP